MLALEPVFSEVNTALMMGIKLMMVISRVPGSR